MIIPIGNRRHSSRWFRTILGDGIDRRQHRGLLIWEHDS